MVNHKIVELMKRRIDELTDDEFAAEIVRQTIQKIEGDLNA